MGMDGDGMIEVLGPKLKDSIWEVNIFRGGKISTKVRHI